MQQTAALLVDAFQPEGITLLAKDSIFMMPHLGVLSQVHPEAAVQVFERDCLIYLGTCLAPRGNGKLGNHAFHYSIKGNELEENGDMFIGQIKRLPLSLGATAQIVVDPARGFDVGAGAGRQLKGELKGGTVGVILDARGRPLMLPEDPISCRKSVSQWVQAMSLDSPVLE